MTTEAHGKHRAVRSYVLRQGRMTASQERALDQLWGRFGVEPTQQPLDLDALFKREAPRVLEIGFGDGENLITQALAHPEHDFIGIEVHAPGVGRVLNQIDALEISNVRVLRHDAVEVLERMIPRTSLAKIQLFFPDPWPKKRHHKRRLVQPDFVFLLSERVGAGGLLHFATDWADYAAQMLAVLDQCPALRNTEAGGGFATAPPPRASTRFERRGLRLGHAVFDLVYTRAYPA
ncbi:MAG: tRNA (guanosine(46)-N7)-methyltransferase TrmB [Thiotrichales bacterium]